MNLTERISRIKTSPLNPNISDDLKTAYSNSKIQKDVLDYLKSLETEDYKLEDSARFYQMLKKLPENKARAVVCLTSTYEGEIKDSIVNSLKQHKFRSVSNLLNPSHTKDNYDERIIQFVELFYGIASKQQNILPKNKTCKLSEKYDKDFYTIWNPREVVSQFFMDCSTAQNEIYFTSTDTLDNIKQLLASEKPIAIVGNPIEGKSKVAKAICKIWANQKEIQYQIPIYLDCSKMEQQSLANFLLNEYPLVFENYSSIQNLLTLSSYQLIIDNYHSLSKHEQQELQNELQEYNQKNCLVFSRTSDLHLLQSYYLLKHAPADQSPYRGLTHDTIYDVQRINFVKQFEEGDLLKEMSLEQKQNLLQEIAQCALEMLLEEKFYMESTNSKVENDMIRYGIGALKSVKSKKYFHFKNLDLQYYFAARLIGKNLSVSTFHSLMEKESLLDFGRMLLAFKSFYCGNSDFINQVLDSQLEKCKQNPNLTNHRRFLTYLSKIDVDTLVSEEHEMQVFDSLDFLQFFQSGWHQQITSDLKIIYSKLQSDFQNQFKNSFVKQLQNIICRCLENYSKENFDALPLFFEMVKTMEWHKSKKFITKLSEIYIEILQTITTTTKHHPELYGKLYDCFEELLQQFKLFDYSEIKNIQRKIKTASVSQNGFLKYWADSSIQYLQSDEFLLAHCDVIEKDFNTRLDHNKDDLSDWVEICYLLAQRHQNSSKQKKERIKNEINSCYDVLIDQRGKGHFLPQLEEQLYDAYMILRLQCVNTSLRFCEKIQKLNVSFWNEQNIDELIQACIKDDHNADNDFISLFLHICESKTIPYQYLPNYLKKIEDRMHAVPHAEKELEFYQQLILKVAKYDSTNNYLLKLLLSFDFKKYKELRRKILLEVMKNSSFHSPEIWSELKDYAHIRQYQNDVISIISKKDIIEDNRNLEHLMIVWHRVVNRGNNPKVHEPLKEFLTKAKTAQFHFPDDFLERIEDVLNKEEVDLILKEKVKKNESQQMQNSLSEILELPNFEFI